jgi:hypothetical protein
MTAPRAMTAAVIGLSNRSQREAAFLRRQCAQVRSGNACGRAAAGYLEQVSRHLARLFSGKPVVALPEPDGGLSP